MAITYYKMIQVSGLAIGLSLAASATPALATSLTAQQILSSFNLVTSGAVTTQQDIEGSAVIGGNLNGATFFNNDVPASPLIDLYGKLGSGPLNLDGGGSLDYAGTVSAGQVNFNGGGSHSTVLANALSTYTAPLNTLSQKLAGLAATPGATISNGTFAANGATGLVVFDLTAAQLASGLGSNVLFSGGSGVTGYIINVTGNFSEPNGVNFNNAQRDALFNFTDATSVSLGNWKASVLAPDASLGILNGYIAGSVYAASFTGGGELHNNNLYDGALPVIAAVPETSTWAMVLAGFAAVGVMLRLRAGAAQPASGQRRLAGRD